jgi:Xaa-Pro aminopeptidase
LRKIATVLLLVGCAAALERQPNSNYRVRREALSLKTNGGVVVLFAAGEAQGPNAIYAFHQDNNFYYLTGWSEPGAALVIAPQVKAAKGTPARPYTEILFLPARNPSQERWTGPKLGPQDPNAAQVTGFERVESLDRLREELAKLLPGPRATVYSDLPGLESPTPSATPLEFLRRGNAFPVYIRFEEVKPLLTSLRMVKDAGELALIRKAVDASVAAHMAAMRTVKPGVGEREVAALMQYEFEHRGCERPAYEPIVASGPRSPLLHYNADSGTVQDGEVVVLDVAGEYSYYAADITRTLPASGHFTDRQREVYDIVLGAQQAAIDAFKAGHSVMFGESPDSLYAVAVEYLNTHGHDLQGQPLSRYFIHGLGHHVGLEVHDPGDYSVPLDKGMVFTLEPGLYITEEKLGIRVEDMFYVDDEGRLVQLTSALPRTAEAVEAAMAGK